MELEKRKEIASYLRWGDYTDIAKQANVSRKTVENWIKGAVKNSTVSPYIIALARKRKEEVERNVQSILNS